MTEAERVLRDAKEWLRSVGDRQDPQTKLIRALALIAEDYAGLWCVQCGCDHSFGASHKFVSPNLEPKLRSTQPQG